MFTGQMLFASALHGELLAVSSRPQVAESGLGMGSIAAFVVISAVVGELFFWLRARRRQDKLPD